MALRQQHPGVVVLGSDFKALGVVRSLGRRGIPSVVIDNLPRSAWFSRYVTKRLRWHGPMEGEAFLNFLLRTGKELHLEQWMLFPLQDDVVELVARNSGELAKIYQLVTQDWSVIRWAHDKRLTYSMAKELGISCPETWYPGSEDELSYMHMTFPVIIKPAISIHFQHATRLKAITVNNHEELLAQYRLASGIINPDEVMVQEIIPGYGQSQYSVATYCKDGQVMLSMTARRTRQYPIDYGLGSSFVEAIEVPELLEPTQKLLRHMGVTGMVEVEFKLDYRDQCYKLLDINVRPWGWHTLCIACGLDFPYIQYRDVLGQAPLPTAPRYNYRWARVLTDIPAGIQEIRAGITKPVSYLHSYTSKTTFSVFDWRDPVPAAGDLVSAISRSMKKSHKQHE